MKKKNMVDQTPVAVTCFHCRRTIYSAEEAKKMSGLERDQAVQSHVCKPGDESKRDFHDEVR